MFVVIEKQFLSGYRPIAVASSVDEACEMVGVLREYAFEVYDSELGCNVYKTSTMNDFFRFTELK